MADEKKPSIFQKVLAAGDSWLEMQISKGRNEVEAQRVKEGDDDEADFFYRKSVAKDQSFYLGTQGYQEKPYRLTYDHLKQMSLKDSVISAIIQTRQNQVAGFTKLVKTPFERGFKINIKDEAKILADIKEELLKTDEFKPKEGKTALGEIPTDDTESSPTEDQVDGSLDQLSEGAGSNVDSMHKAEDEDGDMQADQTQDQMLEDTMVDIANVPVDEEEDSDEADAEEEETNWRLERKARQILRERYADRKRVVEQFILNAGKVKDRPFESKRWNFDTMSRALIRDSFTYDQLGVERVPDEANRVHHVVPVDGSTIRYASPELGKYKAFPLQSNYDILYPEKELDALNAKDALELDPKLLEANKYKWVQVIRGRIERAFTEWELKVGMRNPTSDIFNNGYAVCELELLVNLIASHLNTEFYNQAYFSQGFSAKGILHLKAPLNRRKIETIRQQWQHMIKGSRNSFQTPIFAGMDEVNWIPLTQNHTDIEFQGWLQYLIKMICAIYQIDPQEIGIGMKEEGGKSGGLGGDNTQEKIDLSRDKGLYPLLRFYENFININIIDDVDPDFYLEFVGMKEESAKEARERQKSEAEFKKTVNEIRAEDGLPPLPGMDDVILNAVYFQWYQAYSKKAQKVNDKNQQNMMAQNALTDPGQKPGENEPPEDAADPHAAQQLEGQSQGGGNNPFNDMTQKSFKKSVRQALKKTLKVEYYQIGK